MSWTSKAKAKLTGKDAETVEESPQGDPSAQGVVDDTDDLLDEIDAVLEENAQEFVEQYVQKGGQ